MSLIIDFYPADCSILLAYPMKQALDTGLEEIMHFFMKALDEEVHNAMLTVSKKRLHSFHQKIRSRKMDKSLPDRGWGGEQHWQGGREAWLD